MNLEDVIKKGGFTYVNGRITEKNFPTTTQATEFELVHFNRHISDKDALKELESKGLRPATMWELAYYAGKGWNGTDYVVALGSVWTDPDGDRRVGALWGDARDRSLDPYWLGSGWFARCRFLAVKDSSRDPDTLPSPDPLTLIAEIDRLAIKHHWSKSEYDDVRCLLGHKT